MQCPICNAAVWMGQRYCATCDNYLPQPEEEDHYCPQCSIRVAPQQAICHKCKATLYENAGRLVSAPTAAWKPPPEVLSICIGIGLIIVALSLGLFFKASPEASTLKASSPPQASAEQNLPEALIPRTAETAPSVPNDTAAEELAIASAPESPYPAEVATPAPLQPRYFTNVQSLALRDGPTMSAPQSATLNFKDEVELLETSGGWAKVRDRQRHIVGWSYRRYLKAVAADDSRTDPQHWASGPKEPEPGSSEAAKDL